MSDPSVFINLMLRYPGNRALATGLVDYLLEDDTWGTRQGKLYIVTNDFQQVGHYGGTQSLGSELMDHVEGTLDMVREMHDDGLPSLLAQIFAALLALATAVWIFLVSARPYRRVNPRYASAQPLVAQAGLPGRAAVLAAPTTQRALVVLELKTALEEALRRHLGLGPGVHREALLQEMNRQNRLTQPSLAELSSLMSEMVRIEQSVASARPARVTNLQVEQMNVRMKRLLAELEESRGRV
jgi:hypothetical protein